MGNRFRLGPSITQGGDGNGSANKRTYTRMRAALLESQVDAIYSGRLLTMGTTKHMAVIKGVQHSAEAVELEFQFCNHLEYPFIAALTCVCKEDLGQGFHTSTECPKRASPDEVTGILRRADGGAKPINPEQAEGAPLKVIGNGSHIACTMYVSSAELAKSINDRLSAAFGGDPMKLAEALKNLNYY